MAHAKSGQRPWQGVEVNERQYNGVRNALVGIILDGVAGVSPELPGHGHRMVSPEEADRYIERGQRVLADFESQACAPGGAQGRAQKWMDRTIDELRRFVTDAEAVRSGKKPQKQTPESYNELRKSLGVSATCGVGEDRTLAASDVNFQNGERIRIRVIGPKGQLADPPFWFTVTGTMSVEDVALQFTQTLQPGMFVSISDDKNSWTFQKETHGGQNAVRRTHKLPTARYREASEAGGHRVADKRALIGPGTDGLYKYHGASIEVSSVGLRNWFATVRFRSQEKDFDARSSDDVLEKAMEWIDAAPEHNRDPYGKPIFNEMEENHRVADFNTLDDLIRHARDELGATHTSGTDAQTRLYFPRGGTHPYEEAAVWRKSGYWHAQGPGARTGVAGLPAGAKPIGGRQAGRRVAESGRSRLTPRQIQDFKNGFAEGYREGRHGETRLDGHPASREAAEGIRLGLLAGARYHQGDNSAKTIDDATAAWIEEQDHPGVREAPRRSAHRPSSA